jgi:hypothetical protein
VPTEAVRFNGVAHGFFSLSDRLDAAVEAQALAASALRIRPAVSSAIPVEER